MFTVENTSGYKKKQLDEMNVRLTEKLSGYDPDDLDYEEYVKVFSEQVQKDFDNELLLKERKQEIKTITDLEIGDYATQNNEVAEVKGLHGSQYKYYANTDREYVPENAEINEVNDLFDYDVND